MIVMIAEVTRRTFVARSVGYLSAITLLGRGRWFPHGPFTVRIGIAAPGAMPRDQRLGLELGLDEARHAATLFGGTIVDVPILSSERIDGVLSAIIGAADESATLAWTRRAALSNTIYMNVGCPSDRLRQEDCSARRRPDASATNATNWARSDS
jgi:hypothetical protein